HVEDQSSASWPSFRSQSHSGLDRPASCEDKHAPLTRRASGCFKERIGVLTRVLSTCAVIPFFGMSCDSAQLRREASALHRVAFNRDVPDEVPHRYTQARHVAVSDGSIAGSNWMQRVVAQRADLEAL